MSTTLIVNPRDDPAFASFVQEIQAEGVDNPDDLELRLRQRYPEAVVRLRDLHAETFTIWYVYRDGHWVSGASAPGGAGDGGL
jgi:hypothetical protein